MIKITDSTKKMKHHALCSIHKQLTWIQHCIRTYVSFIFKTLRFRLISPFWIQLGYFLSLSSLCFLALRASKPRTEIPSSQNIDVFFTSVSAVTVSSMSTVEMEVFSDTQLIIMTVFMFMGGEVFTSILGLHFQKRKIEKRQQIMIIRCSNRIESSQYISDDSDHIELGTVITQPIQDNPDSKQEPEENSTIRYKSIRSLTLIASCYLVVINLTGSTLISIYMSLVSSAKQALKRKGLKIATFSIFTTVSTFVNCGFVPTNENMMAFKKNPGLLLILIPLILLGNTLYPVCLRLIIWVLKKITGREEYTYMLKNSKEVGYDHLLSRVYSICLAITVLGLVIVQMIVFCALEWDAKDGVMIGLSGYEKFVGSLFEVVNSRHAGESVFDLSAVSSAILVMFVFIMYLPPYTSFLPLEETEELSTTIEDVEKINKKKKETIWSYLNFSQLSYLVIFIISICITEREKMRSDPLNFNVRNIVVEVISAYGNVGFSVGYSCQRRINIDGYCKDAAYGFAGRWSQKGKIVLIIVMFFGRLKKFNIKGGGEAWNLS